MRHGGRPGRWMTLIWMAVAAIAQIPALSYAQTAAQTSAAKEFAVYQLPEAREVKLANGLTVLMLEKHELPLLSAELGLHSGSVADPAGKEGLGAVTSALLRKGTRTRSAEQISEDMDFIGLSYAVHNTLDYTSLSADFLKKDTETALGLLAEIVLQPAFPEDEVKKLIAQRQDALRSAKDNPQRVLPTYAMKALYGSHPYGRPPLGDEVSIGKLTRADVLAHYTQTYTPANAILALVGDFDPAAMESLLKKLFGEWKGAAPAPVAVAAMKPVTGRHVLLVDKPDATQTYFAIANVGLESSSPDRAPVEVVNTLFGGRFTSMLNEELRVKSGYSYGASSDFELLQKPGPFEISTFTKNATTGPAIDKSFEVLDQLHAHPFHEEDLTSAKNYLRGTFPPSLETSVELAHELVVLAVEGRTRAEFNAELAGEQATTLAEANRVIDRDFPAKDYVLVVIGKASEIASLVAKYGDVTTKKISDPGY